MTSSDPKPERVSALLDAWSEGNPRALDELMELLYRELHRLAHSYMRRERRGHTLQTTGLINELYLRLAAQHSPDLRSRAQFFGIAAGLMRRILVDYARAKRSLKRGTGNTLIPLEETALLSCERPGDLLLLDHALERLEALDARKARVVEFRYFGGLSVEETADLLGVSAITVMRDWRLAKAWLRRELTA